MTTIHHIKKNCFVWDICFNGELWVLYTPFDVTFKGSRTDVINRLRREF